MTRQHIGLAVLLLQVLAACDGSSPDTLDWFWQETDEKAQVIETDSMRCTRCHVACGKAPEGYDGTCTMP